MIVAELLVESSVKVHSNANISDDMRKYREQQYTDIWGEKKPAGGALDSDVTLYEMKRALAGIKQTFPARNIYVMR